LSEKKKMPVSIMPMPARPADRAAALFSGVILKLRSSPLYSPSKANAP
jgi:hypothetical protein